jgi:hypothetical protein
MQDSRGGARIPFHLNSFFAQDSSARPVARGVRRVILELESASAQARRTYVRGELIVDRCARDHHLLHTHHTRTTPEKERKKKSRKQKGLNQTGLSSRSLQCSELKFIGSVSPGASTHRVGVQKIMSV